MTPQEPNHLNRRVFARHTVGSIALGSLGLGATLAQAQPAKTGPASGGRIKQASCRRAFGKISIEEMCQICVKLGLHGIDMVKPASRALAPDEYPAGRIRRALRGL